MFLRLIRGPTTPIQGPDCLAKSARAAAWGWAVGLLGIAAGGRVSNQLT